MGKQLAQGAADNSTATGRQAIAPGWLSSSFFQSNVFFMMTPIVRLPPTPLLPWNFSHMENPDHLEFS
jgi:hypothetical protein